MVLIVPYVDEVRHVPVAQPIIQVSQGPCEDACKREFRRGSVLVPQEVVDKAGYDYDGEDKKYVGRCTMLRQKTESPSVISCIDD